MINDLAVGPFSMLGGLSRAIRGVGLAIFVGSAMGATASGWAAEPAPSTSTHLTGPLGVAPAANWTPAEVVRFQLEALRDNDASDSGISNCFRFASPENRRMTGPLSRFAQMLRTGPYTLMFHYRDVIYHPLEIDGGTAVQRVTLASATRAVTYRFVLTRQPPGECKQCCPNCWMTDGVYIETVEQRVT